ncbi:testis-expressed protein 2-like, partial [Stegodyphus dumicola]|uniref:testis-expressed protein 2-like n=1 Tax=Stegodyphus dumicola TaxID=202533 RepID=UPI0015ADFEC0
GHVKLLKGNYDPDEMPQNYITDLVAICIEKCCLKVSQPQKNSSKEVISKEGVFSSYDLCGAKFLILPKGLSKKSIWKKKYPICVILPLTSEKSLSISDNSEDLDKTCTDYFSFVPYEDGLFESTKQKAMYFFALTDREKESWFWALHNSLAECDKNSCMQILSQCDASPKHDLSTISYSSLLEMNSDENLPEDGFEMDSEVKLSSKTKNVLNFDYYMTTLFENYKKKINISEHSGSFEDHVLDSKQDMHKEYSFLSNKLKISDHSSVDWLNVALGRLFYDFLTQKYWSDDIKARIQKKLDKIEMPTFVESLQVSDVFLGTNLPQIHTVSNLVRDSFGMWIDFDFNYDGSFLMTLKTRLKMTRGKHLENTGITDPSAVKQNGDSIDSSDEDESEAKSQSVNRNKLFNKIEKWISYRHFQTVAQSKFVKRYVGDISNMPLTLTVEVNALHGILTVNIPPVPSDRVWYGFRKDPVLSLTAYPKVGTREINLSAVVQMIERKLIQEFKKALVMPNMDDLIIPIMYTSVYDH